MIGILINTIKIIFLLSFLVFIHEGGHFLVAKFCKVQVNEFAIGFGPIIWQKQKNETKYSLRLIPIGGFVGLEGEVENNAKTTNKNNEKKSYKEASFLNKFAIAVAGPMVNIVFGIITYFLLILVLYNNFAQTINETYDYIFSMVDSIRLIFTGNVGMQDLAGPVGISNMITQTTDIANYIYLLSSVSVSLGIANLLPIPALDGGKILLLLIEKIRKKEIKEQTEVKIQLLGFSLLLIISMVVTRNDIIRIIR